MTTKFYVRFAAITFAAIMVISLTGRGQVAPQTVAIDNDVSESRTGTQNGPLSEAR